MSEATIGRTIWTSCAGERSLYLLVIIGYGNVVSFSYLCLKRALMNPIFIPITLVLWWCCTFYLQEYVLFIYKSMYYLSTRVLTFCLQEYGVVCVCPDTMQCISSSKVTIHNWWCNSRSNNLNLWKPFWGNVFLELWPIHQCWAMSRALTEAGCCLHKFI